MAIKLGITSVLYTNAGNYATPSWTAVTIIRDLANSRTANMADASDRGSPVDKMVPTTFSLEYTGNIKSDASAAWTQLYEAMLEKTLLDLMILDGPNTTNGVTGFRFDAYITENSDSQNRDERLYTAIKIQPGESDNAVKAVLVTAGAATFATVTGTTLSYA